jgi:hypothetical protein
LRRLGDAASRVQTLTVPVLQDLDAAPRDTGSILFRLRDRGDAAADGSLETSAFVEQVMRSLDRATANPATISGEPDTPGGIAGDEFEELSLDSLIVEPFGDIPAEAVAPPRDEPSTPPARAATRAWEQELGLDSTTATSPALWRVSEGLTDDGPAADDGWSRIDPSLPRFKALLAQLERLAAG